jgi:hypothetical protein
MVPRMGLPHRYQKTKNRLLEDCSVLVTSIGLPRLLFPFFFMRPLTVLRQAGCTIKLSILLICMSMAYLERFRPSLDVFDFHGKDEGGSSLVSMS